MLDDAGTSVWHCVKSLCSVHEAAGSLIFFSPSVNSYRSILKIILNHGVLESELLFSQSASLEGKQVGAGARL